MTPWTPHPPPGPKGPPFFVYINNYLLQDFSCVCEYLHGRLHDLPYVTLVCDDMNSFKCLPEANFTHLLYLIFILSSQLNRRS